MNEIEMNGVRYRCIIPRTNKNVPWGGSWEWWNKKFQRWDRVINYNNKIALNKIQDSEHK